MDAQLKLLKPNLSFGIPRRIKIVYGIAVLESTLIILLIFSKPIYVRIVHGFWQRLVTPMKWTLSLDVHVAFAVLFLALLLVQVSIGLLQKPFTKLNHLHRTLGILVLIIAPLFFIATIWNVHVRMPVICY